MRLLVKPAPRRECENCTFCRVRGGGFTRLFVLARDEIVGKTRPYEGMRKLYILPCSWGRVYEIIRISRRLLVKPAPTRECENCTFWFIFGWGRVYEIICLRQLLLLKPAPRIYGIWFFSIMDISEIISHRHLLYLLSGNSRCPVDAFNSHQR